MLNFSPEDKIATAALVNARVAEAMITAMGYVAENEGCAIRNETPVYTKDAFDSLVGNMNHQIRELTG